MDAHHFLESFALVLCVAAVTTVVFQRLRQPVVLGYVIAGLIIGPHVPVPLVGDPRVVEALSELGVILLMFSIGLDFKLRKLVTAGPAALTAIIQSSVMVWLGFLVGQAFGWTVMESIFAGAVVAISSTTIIAKVFDDENVRGPLRDLVVGVLIVEDLIAVAFMATLTAAAASGEPSTHILLGSTARLVTFLLVLLAVGMLIVPRAFRAVARLRRAETTVVASVGFCFGLAVLAQKLGYSVALGAFIAGALVAESGEEKEVERLIQPIRDMFAAVFFVSVGLRLDPALVLRHAGAICALTAVVLVGKIGGVSLGAFLSGRGIRTSVAAGMSLAQIGEFSFIIAALGISLGATREFLYPVAVSVSAITTLTTPWLIRWSDRAAIVADHKLPRRLQTFAALYGTWFERLSRAPRRPTVAGKMRRLVGLLLIDAGLLAAVVITAATRSDAFTLWAAREFGIDAMLSRILVLGAAAALMLPLSIGVLRIAGSLGVTIAELALPPEKEERVDLAAAPRRAFVVALQTAIVLPVALTLLALTQPFVNGPAGAIALALLFGALAIGFYRSTTNLQGHARAGARMIVEALAKQSRGGARSDAETMEQVRSFLPGLGEPVSVRLLERSPAVGRTLAQLDVRGRTGATVLAIARADEGVIIPTGEVELRAGDYLAVAGTAEAVEAAVRVLLEDA